MDKISFMSALKLIAIKQNGKSLDDYKSECMTGSSQCLTPTLEHPLPQFCMEEFMTLKAKIEETAVEKNADVFISG